MVRWVAARPVHILILLALSHHLVPTVSSQSRYIPKPPAAGLPGASDSAGVTRRTHWKDKNGPCGDPTLPCVTLVAPSTAYVPTTGQPTQRPTTRPTLSPTLEPTPIPPRQREKTYHSLATQNTRPLTASTYRAKPTPAPTTRSPIRSEFDLPREFDACVDACAERLSRAYPIRTYSRLEIHRLCTPECGGQSDLSAGRYVGCYEDSEPGTSFCCGPKSYEFSAFTCQKACAGFRFFSLQAEGFCACDNELGDPSIHPRVPDRECGSVKISRYGGRGGAENRSAVYFSEIYTITTNAPTVPSPTPLPDVQDIGWFGCFQYCRENLFLPCPRDDRKLLVKCENAVERACIERCGLTVKKKETRKSEAVDHGLSFNTEPFKTDPLQGGSYSYSYSADSEDESELPALVSGVSEVSTTAVASVVGPYDDYQDCVKNCVIHTVLPMYPACVESWTEECDNRVLELCKLCTSEIDLGLVGPPPPDSVAHDFFSCVHDCQITAQKSFVEDNDRFCVDKCGGEMQMPRLPTPATTEAPTVHVHVTRAPTVGPTASPTPEIEFYRCVTRCSDVGSSADILKQCVKRCGGRMAKMPLASSFFTSSPSSPTYASTGNVVAEETETSYEKDNDALSVHVNPESTFSYYQCLKDCLKDIPECIFPFWSEVRTDSVMWVHLGCIPFTARSIQPAHKAHTCGDSISNFLCLFFAIDYVGRCAILWCKQNVLAVDRIRQVGPNVPNSLIHGFFLEFCIVLRLFMYLWTDTKIQVIRYRRHTAPPSPLSIPMMIGQMSRVWTMNTRTANKDLCISWQQAKDKITSTNGVQAKCMIIIVIVQVMMQSN